MTNKGYVYEHCIGCKDLLSCSIKLDLIAEHCPCGECLLKMVCEKVCSLLYELYKHKDDELYGSDSQDS